MLICEHPEPRLDFKHGSKSAFSKIKKKRRMIETPDNIVTESNMAMENLQFIVVFFRLTFLHISRKWISNCHVGFSWILMDSEAT